MENYFDVPNILGG